MPALEFALRCVLVLAAIICGCIALSVVLAWIEDWAFSVEDTFEQKEERNKP